MPCLPAVVCSAAALLFGMVQPRIIVLLTARKNRARNSPSSNRADLLHGLRVLRGDALVVEDRMTIEGDVEEVSGLGGAPDSLMDKVIVGCWTFRLSPIS
jgi:hypothetical protein